MIKIDLYDTFDVINASDDLKSFSFNSELKDDTSLKLHVKLSEHPDPFLPNVFNLAFGPTGKDNIIDDTIVVGHKNLSKVFSTILFCAITFLKYNRDNQYYIGMEGSDERRAYLYDRMFRYNNAALSDNIVTIGVDWYVKLLRDGTDIERDKGGLPFFKPILEPFDLRKNPRELYRYYLFSLHN